MSNTRDSDILAATELAVEWTNGSPKDKKGDIFEARFVFDNDDHSVVHVEISPCKHASQQRVMRILEACMLAYGHCANNLYNLGDDTSATTLLYQIKERAEAIEAHPSLEGTFSDTASIAKRSHIQRGSKWRTILQRNRNKAIVTTTKVPILGSNPRVMAPASVLGLFDCVMQFLRRADADQHVFLLGLGAMHDYYSRHGHTEFRQSLEAPFRAASVIFVTLLSRLRDAGAFDSR